MIAIYKDTFYEFPEDKFIYSIEEVSGNTLFQGKAYKFPDSESGSVMVNKVCQNYLYNDLPDLSTISASTTYTHSGMTGAFNVCDSGGNVVQTYEFINDWNYDSTDYSQNQTLSLPVNSHFATNQFQFLTSYNKNTKKVSTQIIRTANPNACGDYAVYYTNRKGGWDSFLFEGIVAREEDSFSPYDFERYVTTGDRSKKGEMVRYMNIVSKTFELSTGWMNDAQARTLARHLMSSNNVFLHNLVTDEIMPAVIDDGSAEYKRFLNDKRLISYTIKVKCANKELLC